MRRFAAGRADNGACGRDRLPDAPAWYGLALPLYLFAFLALDTRGVGLQLAIAAVTWVVLLAACVPLVVEQRLRVALVVLVATVGEVTGSLIWGVYTYRLDNLPAYIPPGHGLVYLGGLGLSVALARHGRVIVVGAAVAALVWGIAGLGLLPRLDVAGALGIPLLLFCLWRARNRTVYAGVFIVVMALEVYGTWLGVWTWRPELPGLGIPQGNPPSGVASGYVFFDVFAVFVAARLMRWNPLRRLGVAQA
ncbi:MAG: hypothetical protein WD689_08890 [Gaiellaceae bacterium]